jgi:RND superfamily putative drug exporter
LPGEDIVFAACGRLACQRRVAVVLVWTAVLVVGAALGGRLFARLQAGNELRRDAESVIAAERLDALEQRGPRLVFLVDGRRADDPGLRDSVAAATAAARSTPGVLRVIDHPSTQDPGLVARDRHAQLVMVELQRDLSGAALDGAIDRVTARLRAIAAPRVLVGGEVVADREFRERAERDLRRGEALALPFMLVLLLVAFRGLAGAVVPLLVAAVAVSGALVLLLGVSELTVVSSYAVNVVSMMGLGLAVDYSLLIISRFREERAAGLEPVAAVERTLATAGRTVAFSGLAVAVALSGLLAFAEPFLRSLAWGGIGVVLVAMAAALTLVPALLIVLARWIRPYAAPRPDPGVFYRLSRLVQRRAGVIAPLLAAGLVVLALPFRHANLQNSGTEVLPASSSARQLTETVQRRFAQGAVEPITVVAGSDPRSAAFRAFVTQVRSLPGVAGVELRRGLPGGVAVLDVIPAGSSQGPTATRLVRQLRQRDGPVAGLVTGGAAALVDYRDSLLGRLPVAVGLMALATLTLLFLMTGSVVVPLKAIVMNVLSLGASMGALVWVFQEGHLAWLLGFDPAGQVDLSIPLLMFVFSFGLSMDYELFLLARIKEAYDQTAVNDHAVALGLQRTGGIVTSAASLMVIVFLGFATSELLPIKQVGIGLALAVLLDATVVRTLLVPATMRLMGRWNWWAPARLRRLHVRIGLSELPSQPPPDGSPIVGKPADLGPSTSAPAIR